jgi:hypothetical protein
LTYRIERTRNVGLADSDRQHILATAEH